jgi:hypothetical protein
MMPFSHSLKS